LLCNAYRHVVFWIHLARSYHPWRASADFLSAELGVWFFAFKNPRSSGRTPEDNCQDGSFATANFCNFDSVTSGSAQNLSKKILIIIKWFAKSSLICLAFGFLNN